MRVLLTLVVLGAALAGCSRSDPELKETGPEPDLPAVAETLFFLLWLFSVWLMV
jgi:hypothetical protein